MRSTTSETGLPLCGATARLPERLALAALRLAPEPYGEPEDARLERDLWCTREAHGADEHHALVRELDGVRTGAVWTRWRDGGRPRTVTVLPDCPAVMTRTDGGSEACAEFLGHPGGHSWELGGG
ncbi:hypothetical protein AB0910_18780 [Streptomyces sp. NPDC047002]|uniref:hypothetical protein n=1 Tax=Streptomyces sp. NPDC047002 TaxID=3155475 RepID=UPI003452DA54